MPYRSNPYPPGTDEYPTYKVIYQYQQQHASKYAPYIRLNRVVTRLRHTPQGHASCKRWLVEWTNSMASKSTEAGRSFEEEFDHVVVANGSDSRPFIPYIDGLWDWKGEVLHSRWYRDAKAFSGKVSSILMGTETRQEYMLTCPSDRDCSGCWAVE